MFNEQENQEGRTKNTPSPPYKYVRIEQVMEKFHKVRIVLELYSIKNVNVFGTFSEFPCFRFYMFLSLQCFHKLQQYEETFDFSDKQCVCADRSGSVA